MTSHLSGGVGSTSRTIIDDCDALLARLRGLSDQDYDQSLLQDRLEKILTYRKRLRPVMRRYIEISVTASRALNSATQSVALSLQHETPDAQLFASLQVVVKECPGLSALSTLLHYGKQRSTELKILALLIAHSLECELDNGREIKQVLDHWADVLHVKARAVAEIEAVGRFCLDVLGVDNNRNPGAVEPIALGTLALLQQFKSLKSLAIHGRKFLSACKEIPGCIDRAMHLAPIVYTGIQRAAAAICLPILPTSSLGKMLAAHERLNPVLRRELSIPRPHTTSSHTMLPYNCPIFDLVADCNFVEVEQMVRARAISINAVDPFGLGLFYHAAYYGWRHKGPVSALPMCLCLLELGIDLRWGDEIGNAPLETLLDSILVSQARDEAYAMFGPAHLEDIAQWFERGWEECRREYLSKRSFNALHEALLKLSDGDTLESVLQRAQHNGDLQDMLEAGDAQGRTVLTWAVEYHDVESTALLVAHGANVNYCRRTHNTHLPLLHLALAAKDVPQDLLTCLLDAGADANARDHEGWTAAHIAASWQDQRSLDTLLAHSKQAIDPQARTWEGQSVEDLMNQLS